MSARQRRPTTLRSPPFIRRLFKFSSMSFETAIWEMTHLLYAPRQVFRNIYYHQQTSSAHTYHRPDPAFTYLLSLFTLFSGLAWGIAYAPGALAVVKVTLVFVLVHFLGVSLAVAGGMYFLVGRVLGRRRRRGLFGPPGDGDGDGAEGLEFGYCFDVAIRAFLPLWTFLYVLQFLLLPLIARDYWVSVFAGNTMYLLALSYYFVITFLGYNALPFLSRTEALLAPIPVLVILWIISLFTFDCATNLAPVLWCGVNLRKAV
ncbi:hypothetical protein LTR53_014209 [Teratosphaeriaceae sp. CCFEE 6253]|nr:hypothetical protein LTR53_014209 [Teratosphaeriaceae sp. CCFEE 6253]